MKPLFNSHMLLSEHFSLSEMLASETAEKHHIPNTPLKCHITALQNLVQRCLEPTRQHFGLPIQVNSGYRCPQLNAAVKGASNSQHLAGEAADITIPRKHWPFCYTSSEQIARLLFTWMKDNVDLDQLILEQRADRPPALYVDERQCRFRPADPGAQRRLLVGARLLPHQLPPQPPPGT